MGMPSSRGWGGPWRGAGAVMLLALLAVSPAGAVEPPPTSATPMGDPDTELARGHFSTGLTYYNQSRFAEALVEFERARALKPRPAFDYNIARCYERLEDWREAAAAYRRYLASSPSKDESLELEARVKVLEERARRADGETRADAAALATAVRAAPRPAPALRTRRWVIWVGVGAAILAVGAAATATAVVLSRPSDPQPTLGAISWK